MGLGPRGLRLNFAEHSCDASDFSQDRQILGRLTWRDRRFLFRIRLPPFKGSSFRPTMTPPSDDFPNSYDRQRSNH